MSALDFLSFETKKKIKLKYYNRIDQLPIINFIECSKGNLQYLYKYQFDEVPKKYPEHFEKIFNELIYQFEYIDNNLLRILNKAVRLENKYITTKEIKFANLARETYAEYKRLKDITDKKGTQPFEQQVAILESWLKRDIDVYKMPTSRYYTHLRNYEKYLLSLNKKDV